MRNSSREDLVACWSLSATNDSSDDAGYGCRHATNCLLLKETTDLQTWHKYNVKKVRAFLFLQARQKPQRKHRTVFSVARLRRPTDGDQ